MTTVIDKNSGEVLWVTDGDFQNTDSLLGINNLITENFIKPFFDFQTETFYEGATEEEINIHNINNLPLEVALWKLRFVLSEMQLEDLITSAIEQLPEPHKKAATYIWNYGNSIDRFSSTISFIQDHLDLSENQVNEIFIQANSITL